MPPFVSKTAWAQALEPSSPLVELGVSQGDYVFALGRSRAGGGVPEMVTLHASSSWTVLFSDISKIFAYRKATADEPNLSVRFIFPDGFGDQNWYNADGFLVAVTGAVRMDITSAIGINSAPVTLDGYSANPHAGGEDAVGLAVLFSADGHAMPLAGVFSDLSFGGADLSLSGPTTFANAVPGSDGAWTQIWAGGPAIIEFPRTIRYKAIGGDSFFTSINKAGGGAEDREANRALARKKWEVSLITPAAFAANPRQFIDLLLAFFLNYAGKAYAFRVFDNVDHTALGEPLLPLGGSDYQLAKRYQVGGRTYTRKIYKPITAEVFDWQGVSLGNTVKLYNAGILVDPASYSVDTETGVLSSGLGGPLTADFDFDYPARFDTDELMMQIEESFVAGDRPIMSANSISLIEVLPENF